ncbi:MAG TPA: hypothetical protein VHA52_03365, partial [Candidatus Babeliaceae bacterium]|nr:hypothetical protein [Candidatus Babeliaceae bacterium]
MISDKRLSFVELIKSGSELAGTIFFNVKTGLLIRTITKLGEDVYALRKTTSLADFGLKVISIASNGLYLMTFFRIKTLEKYSSYLTFFSMAVEAGSNLAQT